MLFDFVYSPLPAPRLPSVLPTDPDWQFSTSPHHLSPSITLSITKRPRGNTLGKRMLVKSFRLHLSPHTIAVFISRYLKTKSIQSESQDLQDARFSIHLPAFFFVLSHNMKVKECFFMFWSLPMGLRRCKANGSTLSTDRLIHNCVRGAGLSPSVRPSCQVIASRRCNCGCITELESN